MYLSLSGGNRRIHDVDRTVSNYHSLGEPQRFRSIWILREVTCYQPHLTSQQSDGTSTLFGFYFRGMSVSTFLENVLIKSKWYKDLKVRLRHSLSEYCLLTGCTLIITEQNRRAVTDFPLTIQIVLSSRTVLAKEKLLGRQNWLFCEFFKYGNTFFPEIKDRHHYLPTGTN